MPKKQKTVSNTVDTKLVVDTIPDTIGQDKLFNLYGFSVAGMSNEIRTGRASLHQAYDLAILAHEEWVMRQKMGK